MKFYFNTVEQKNGDRAYYNKDFALALEYYLKALNILNNHASHSRGHLAETKEFYDAYAHVLGDIIITKCDLMLNKKFDLTKITEFWQEIDSLLNSMEVAYSSIASAASAIKTADEIQTTPDWIDNIYRMVSETCEDISGDIIDIVDEEVVVEELEINDLTLNDAIIWIEKALNYYAKTNLPIKIELHLSYLYILERQFKESLDDQEAPTYLNAMEEHLKAQDLLERRDSFNLLQNLELLGYALLHAINNKDIPNDTINNYSHSCKTIISNLKNEELDASLISDIENLISQAEARVRKENVVIELMDYEEDNKEETSETQIFAQQQDSEEDEGEKIEEVYDGDFDLPTTVPSPSNSSLGKETTINRLPVTKNIFWKTSCTTTNNSPKDFAEAAISSQAFLVAIGKITSRKDIKPQFLSIILALTADFFADYINRRPQGLQPKNSVLMAHTLYKAAIEIDPQNQTARTRSLLIVKNHTGLFPNYGAVSISHKLRDPRIETLPILETPIAQDKFSKTLTELTTELETFFGSSSETLQKLLQELVNNIGNIIISARLARNSSEEIARILFLTYTEEFARLTNTAHLKDGSFIL